MSLTPNCRDTGGGAAAIFPYPIDYSALLNGGYMSRTPAVSGNMKTWSFGTSFKRSELNEYHYLLQVFTEGADYVEIRIEDTNVLRIYLSKTSGVKLQLATTLVLSDPTDWYNLLFTLDTSLATPEFHLYLNEKEVTAFDIETNNLVQNEEFVVNQAGQVHYLFTKFNFQYSFKDYVANTYLVDGTALALSDVGESSDQVTGLWILKNISSLDFGDEGSLLEFGNAIDLGEDSSGNGNDWAVSGSPVQTLDTPTNKHCTFNPLIDSWNSNDTTLSNGNTTTTSPSNSNFVMAMGDQPFNLSEGVYWELDLDTLTTSASFYAGAVQFDSPSINMLIAGNNYFTVNENNYYADGGTAIPWSSPGIISTGDILRFALKDGKMWVGINNDWLESGDPANDTNPLMTGLRDKMVPFVTTYRTDQIVTLQSGARGFTYAAPAGFNPLDSTSIAVPTILKSEEYVETILFTAPTDTTVDLKIGWDVGSTDWLMILKNRDSVESWVWVDTVRGLNKYWESDTSDVEGTLTTAVTVSGSTVTIPADLITNGDDYVVTFIRSCPESGLDIVKYTGDSTSGKTVPHGLGQVPTVMIVNNLEVAGQHSMLYHVDLGPTMYVRFNLDLAAGVSSATWNDTAPTSTEFTLGSTGNVNQSGYEHVAYLFADGPIFKAFSFEGNGLADGPFVNLGGKPLSLPFVKADAAGAQWYNSDAARSPLNPVDKVLYSNLPNAEVDNGIGFNFASTGFKLGTNDGNINPSGTLVVGLAILESTKYSNAY